MSMQNACWFFAAAWVEVALVEHRRDVEPETRVGPQCQRLEIAVGEHLVEIGGGRRRRGLEEGVVVVPRHQIAGVAAEAGGETLVERALPGSERRPRSRRRRRRGLRRAGARRARSSRARARSGRAGPGLSRPRCGASRVRVCGRRSRLPRSSTLPTPARRCSASSLVRRISRDRRCRRPRHRRSHRGAARTPTRPRPATRRSCAEARPATGWARTSCAASRSGARRAGRLRLAEPRGARRPRRRAGSASTSETARSVSVRRCSVSASACTADVPPRASGRDLERSQPCFQLGDERRGLGHRGSYLAGYRNQMRW